VARDATAERSRFDDGLVALTRLSFAYS
jgi:hypothetical protein